MTHNLKVCSSKPKSNFFSEFFVKYNLCVGYLFAWDKFWFLVHSAIAVNCLFITVTIYLCNVQPIIFLITNPVLPQYLTHIVVSLTCTIILYLFEGILYCFRNVKSIHKWEYKIQVYVYMSTNGTEVPCENFCHSNQNVYKMR